VFVVALVALVVPCQVGTKELRVARTFSAAHTTGNLLSVTPGPIPSASDVVMVPITMRPAAVVEGDETNEHIFERMDVDTGPGMDTCEIPAMCYKTKWYTPTWEPLHEIGWIFPAETLRPLPGLKKIDATLLFGKKIHRLVETAKNESGNSIAGFFLIVDVIHALFFAHRVSALNWCRRINNINNIIAPSLNSIPNGNSSGGTQYVASYVDALRIIVRYCKMTDVVFDIANAVVEGECAITNVDDILAKCEVVSLSVYHQRKIESQRLCEKQKAACDLHDISAPCVVCKGGISDFGYRQHCFDCYVKQFPAIRHEVLVRGVIDATFEGFIHNKVMPSCGRDKTCRRKIDHRLQIGNTILAVETDERAHTNYEKGYEERRYNEFASAFPHKFAFIRFNPNTNMEEPHAEGDHFCRNHSNRAFCFLDVLNAIMPTADFPVVFERHPNVLKQSTNVASEDI